MKYILSDTNSVCFSDEILPIIMSVMPIYATMKMGSFCRSGVLFLYQTGNLLPTLMVI